MIPVVLAARHHAARLVACGGLLAAASAPVPALAQSPVSVRILQVEDARELSTAAQEVLVEGTRDASPAVRAQAVRAMGRFESPALMSQILPLLADADASVRQAAAVAAANAAKVFPMQAIEALTAAMRTASPADWAVLAASLGRITLPDAGSFTAAEQAIAAGLPAPPSNPANPENPKNLENLDPPRVEGAARGLEALVRVNGTLGTLTADTRARLTAVLAMTEGPHAASLARARRLSLLALRTARLADGALLVAAAKDPDDEVRRLAMTAAAAAATPDGAPITDAQRDAVLLAGLKDAEPRVRLDALRGWGRRQARDCEPIVTALTDTSTHVALQALDLIGDGCPAGTAVVPLLRRDIDALPATGAAWHRGAHALVSLARVAPDEARPLVDRVAGHATWQVRTYAARAAGRLQATEVLVALGADAHDNVRQAALDELVRLERPEALAVAYEGLKRPDYQLRMTAARALAAETNRATASAALLAALDELTAQGHDTSRDPRVAILTTLAAVGEPAAADRLAPYLKDWDPRVAELAARTLTQWTGAPHEATPARRPPPAPTAEALAAVQDKWLRITMADGGVMELRLLPEVAPATVLRVAGLTGTGYYSGLTFHRVEPTFVLQGGSPGANEFMGDGLYMRDEPGVAHHRGTVGISTRGRDTGDAQIFVNLVDSPRLDHVYTVFAVVEDGMDVADRVLEGDVLTRVEVVDGPLR